jgi:hypothetical protein
MVGRSVGALIVTDRRVMFVHTPFLRRRTKVMSFDLVGVTEADAPPVSFMKDRGSVIITMAEAAEASSSVEFKQIDGGEQRAAEIAGSIIRERERLRGRSSNSD